MEKTIPIPVRERDLCIPKTPNFIRTEGGDIYKVQDLSKDALRKLGKAWTNNLIEKAHGPDWP